MSVNLQVPSTWIAGQQVVDKTQENIESFLVEPEQVRLFESCRPRAAPYAFVHIDVPCVENRVGYNSTCSFNLDKIGDYLANAYVSMTTAPLLYMPLRDRSVTRACWLADLPEAPVSDYLGGLSRLDTQATWIDYMGYAMLQSATFGPKNAAVTETVTGDYLFLKNDTARHQDTSFSATLPDTVGGANNLGNNQQAIFVPLLFSWAQRFADAFPLVAAHYCTPQIKVKIGPAPFRSDATSFQIPGYDSIQQKLYAGTNGPDILPHQMYERYAELRNGAWTGVVAVSVLQSNQADILNGDYVPQLSLVFRSPGVNSLTTKNQALDSNVLKLVRRNTMQFDTSGLVFPSTALRSQDGSRTAFVWDYTPAANFITFTSGTGTPRTDPSQPSASSLRLYGTLDSGYDHVSVTVTYAGMRAFTVTCTTAGAPSSMQSTVAQAGNSSQSWSGTGLMAMTSVPGKMGFRVDPVTAGELQINDSWTFLVTNQNVPLSFTISDQPWAAPLPATYFEAPTGTSSVMFTYSGALQTTDSSLTLDSLKNTDFRGFVLPTWLNALDNGNALYYSTGRATPAVLRPTLGGVVAGVFSDGLNFDYLLADPGQRVDGVVAGAVVATDVSGLFAPLFAGKLGMPSVGSFPQGYTTLPVYCYRVVDDPVYHEAVYNLVSKGNTLMRYDGPSTDIGGTVDRMSLLTNRIFLNDKQSTEVSAATHKKLYTEVQQQTFRQIAGDQSPRKLALNFTGPVKALYFFFRPDDNDTSNTDATATQDYWGWQLTDIFRDQDFFSNCTLLLNGKPLFDPPQPPVFYKHTLPTQYLTSTPRQRVYMMPFCVNPDSPNPTGSLNTSLYSDVSLVFNYSNGGILSASGNLQVYADSHQVWAMRSGNFGKLFSN